LGTFGMSLAKSLTDRSAQVLAIDVNKGRVDEASSLGVNAVVADATEEKILKKLGLKDFDVGVVAIGENLEASILTTLLLKDMGIKHIIVKSMSEHHSRIAGKVGADRVIYPESDMAVKLADAMLMPSIIEEIELSKEYNLVEIVLPKVFFDKTLAESKLKETYNLTVIAIRRKETVISDDGSADIKEDMLVSPESREVLQEGDVILVVGKEADTQKLRHLSEK
ncbi:MAG: TrkA family potassium uptake protein, partial [Endomicrobiia bacterium]|nr:TrkA family potassium uptake protein [Endomicrobiia bacterium]